MSIYRVIEHKRGELLLRQWQRRLFRALALLGIGLVACMAGLMLFDPSGGSWAGKAFDALWNAANTVSTLGAFTTFTRAQRAFLLVTMFFFLMIGGYGMSTLTGVLSSDEVRAHRENTSMTKALENLAGHAVVVGFGPVGRLVAERLRKAGNTVVVIDSKDGPAAEASGFGYLVILGDAGADETPLIRARIDTARALFVTTEDPDRKLTITLMAHTANPQLAICATAQDDVRGALLRRAGASEVVVVDTLVAGALVERFPKAVRG